MLRYNDSVIDYSQINEQEKRLRADLLFKKATGTKDAKEKQDLLEQASGEYFLLTKIAPQNLYYMVRLARIYDLENKNSFAKGYFFNALKIDKNNAETNYYLGEYYYRRNQYTKALYFYDIALNNGYGENYEILIKMASMYEKLGDLLRANQYYKKAYLLNPQNAKISGKIKEIEQVKYKTTGYYKMGRRQTK